MPGSLVTPSPRVPRLVVGGGTLIATALASAVFADILRTDGVGLLDVVLLVLFVLLFAWVAQGFFTAVLGTALVLRRREVRRGEREERGGEGEDRSQPTRYASPALPRTAIVMPIYNEDPTRVMAGLRATYDSLRATGHGDAFDFFLVSDTNDPDRWLEEESAWATMCLDACAGQGDLADDGARSRGGQIFYRRRPYNTARKSGNIADFCQRWGRLYECMVVLDADSLMEGATLVAMARRMAAEPRLGILQAPPQPVNRESLFARMMQFAAAMYSPVFNAGFAAWTGDEGNYYGHNAIIRTQAFMEHCGLPHLPGDAPLGGEILSHDFVEAAMLRRNRWLVRIDPDLNGSYEEMPTTLIDYAKRDRRWCQGNMQHVRIALAKRITPVSRLHLLMGAMAYLASPLWLLFMVLMVVAHALADQRPGGDGPGWLTGTDLLRWQALGLFATVMAMLLVPKGLAYGVVQRDREARARFGGAGHAAASVLLETAFSVLLAPVMMAFHSRFVYETLTGRVVAWVTQQREEHGTPLRDALLNHRGQVATGAIAGAGAWLLAPGLFWWLLPVTLGLVVSPLLSSLTSGVGAGLAARRWKLFLVPAETDPPAVLYQLHQWLADAGAEPREEAAVLLGGRPADRFARAVLDPTLNTLHVSLLRAYGSYVRETPQLVAARTKALEHGPQALSKAEKLAILSHEESVRWLHGAAWQRWPVS